MPSTVENAYRFVLCLYIDTILFDRNINMNFLQNPSLDDDNITQKLKYLLARITCKAFESYSEIENNVDYNTPLPAFIDMINSESKNILVRRETETNSLTKKTMTSQLITSPTMTTSQTTQKATTTTTTTTVAPTTKAPLYWDSDEQIYAKLYGTKLSTGRKLNNVDLIENESMEESCHLEALPETPSNSFIREIKIENETIFNKPDRLYLIGPVAIRTRAYFSCKDGFKTSSNTMHYFECSETLKWAGTPIECQGLNYKFSHFFHT